MARTLPALGTARKASCRVSPASLRDQRTALTGFTFLDTRKSHECSGNRDRSAGCRRPFQATKGSRPDAVQTISGQRFSVRNFSVPPSPFLTCLFQTWPCLAWLSRGMMDRLQPAQSGPPGKSCLLFGQATISPAVPTRPTPPKVLIPQRKPGIRRNLPTATVFLRIWRLWCWINRRWRRADLRGE